MSHLSFNYLHCAFISSIESFNNFNLAGYFLNKVVPIPPALADTKGVANEVPVKEA